MTSRRILVASKWALLLLWVPLLVIFGTYSDSVLSPLGWIAAVLVLAAAFIAVVRRSSRHRLPESNSR